MEVKMLEINQNQNNNVFGNNNNNNGGGNGYNSYNNMGYGGGRHRISGKWLYIKYTIFFNKLCFAIYIFI